MSARWLDAPTCEGLWWRKQRDGLVADVVRVTRNAPSFSGANVEEFGRGAATVWTAAQLAQYQWCEARTP